MKASDLPIEEYNSLLNQVRHDFSELEEELKFNPTEVIEVVPLVNWWELYEYDFAVSVYLFYYFFTDIKDLNNKKLYFSPQDMTQILSDSLLLSLESQKDSLTKEEKYFILSLILNLLFAMRGNIVALSLFGHGHSQGELVAEARDHDNTEAFFKAILVDKATLITPTAKHFIAKAILINDSQFFDHLSKAVKGSRPRKPNEKNNKVRLLDAII